MKQQLLLWLLVFAITSCSTHKKTLSLDAVFTQHFGHKMISSGPNFPDFYAKKDSVDLFLIGLHEQIPIEEFQKKVGWTDSTLQAKIEFLKAKNWLNQSEELKPSIFIASDLQGKGLFNYGLPISLEISRSIEEELKNTEAIFNEMSLSEKHSFEELSFFIFSNVLLDNWQINNVEREFLNAKQRPERHGKHYYYAIMENVLFPKEEFGIYGNQYRRLNDTLAIAIYGNNRHEATDNLKDKNYLENILKNAPRLSEEDNKKLEEMADSYKPKLLNILNKNKAYIRSVYEKTGYASEIIFREFFIWWYHFIYTDATNILAENGILTLPDDGNFYYVIEN